MKLRATRSRVWCALGLTGALLLSGCGSSPTVPADGRPSLVAAFYPLEYLAHRLGADLVTVTSLTAAGAEPHDIELTPKQVVAARSASILLYEKGFQPALDEIAQLTPRSALDVAVPAKIGSGTEAGAQHDEAEHGHDDEHEHDDSMPPHDDGHEHDDENQHEHDDSVPPHDDRDASTEQDHDHAPEDPQAEEEIARDRLADEHAGHDHAHTPDSHFWLDPTRFADVARAVAARLTELDPVHAERYSANLQALVADLTALDSDYAAGLRQCTDRTLVTSHAAFGALAARYGFVEEPIAGLSPEAEPGPADLARLVAFVRDHDIRTVYAEVLVPPATARTLAREAEAQVAVLDPIEAVTAASAGEDYLQIMRTNLATLRAGQDCS